MFKKNLLLAIILILTLSALGFNYYFKKQENQNLDSLEKLKTPSSFTFTEQKCYFEDSINFREYQEKEASKEKVQDIIGHVNNKFGLYVYSEENFIKKADEMINSNGGDWGYVLIPYNVRDYDNSKWRSLFDLLSKKHLIPIIQLWDIDPEHYKKETEGAAQFLNKFPWPVKNKYISAYNEMNDPNFFRGGANPEVYAEILDYTIKTFKSYDNDFFILNGAFNATAPNVRGYYDEEVFMVQMNEKVPDIFKKLDGWASHSYPADYVGSPNGNGRGSVRGYEWELSVLKNRFGVEKIPVFITETGWAHAEGQSYSFSYLDSNTAASNLKQAFEKVWLPDERVVAVTPFTIYYDSPFDHFSFVKKDGSVYPQFDLLKQMKKTSGKPPVLFQTEKEIISCP